LQKEELSAQFMNESLSLMSCLICALGQISNFALHKHVGQDEKNILT